MKITVGVEDAVGVAVKAGGVGVKVTVTVKDAVGEDVAVGVLDEVTVAEGLEVGVALTVGESV